MKYYDDFFDKYGFSDGADVPPDADVYRHLIVAMVNHAAEHLGSKYRLACYDRPGMHNGIMLCILPAAIHAKREEAVKAGKQAYHDLPDDKHVIWQPHQADAKLQEAVQMMDGLDTPMDEYIEVTVKVNTRAALRGIKEELKAAGKVKT